MNDPHVKGSIPFFVNGQMVKHEYPPTYRLIDILRDHLQLTGTKVSCEIGRCGACSCLMNGQLVNACLIMAYQLEGAEIETIEGISDKELHPIQEAFLQGGGLQCGYCTPGMIMAVKSLTAEISHPTREQILAALSGNLCRCTGYEGILRAVDFYIEQQDRKGNG